MPLGLLHFLYFRENFSCAILLLPTPWQKPWDLFSHLMLLLPGAFLFPFVIIYGTLDCASFPGGTKPRSILLLSDCHFRGFIFPTPQSTEIDILHLLLPDNPSRSPSGWGRLYYLLDLSLCGSLLADVRHHLREIIGDGLPPDQFSGLGFLLGNSKGKSAN